MAVAVVFALTHCAMTDYPLTPGRRSQLRGSGQILDWMVTGTDLAENPRLSDGGVDIGCYRHVPKESGFIVIMF